MGLAKRIIPCLDVAEGRVVKGVNFVNLRDAGDPVEVARRYDEQGADELAFLDIRASVETRGLLYDMIEAVADAGVHPADRGRRRQLGRRHPRAAQRRRRQGQHQHGRRAQPRPRSRKPSARYGAQCIVAAIDAKQSAPEAWEVYTHGGRTPTGMDAVDWAREVVGRGAGEILLTSMDRDGARTGFDLALTRAVVDAVDVPVIASGGVGSLAGPGRRRSVEGGADAVLAASIFHYGEFTIGAGEGGDGRRGHRESRRMPCARAPSDPDSRSTSMDWLDAVKWQADGLVPAIAQDAATGKVLTLAWMNREALAHDRAHAGGALLVALARAQLWRKGETVGPRAARARDPARLRRRRDPASSSSRWAASPATPGARRCFFQRLDEGRVG